MKKRTIQLLTSILIVGGVALVAQNAQSQVVVYDNGTASSYYGNYNFNNAAAGNEIILANSGNTYISEFQFQFDLVNSNSATPLAGAPTGNEEVDLTFYQNNGPVTNGYASPGTEIYDSGFYSLGAIGLNSFTLGTNSIYNPDVSVPQDFTWAVTFSNVPPSESAGLALRSLPTTGTAYGDVWENDGAGWHLNTDNSDVEGNLDLGAEAETPTVVPEPSWLWLVNVAAGAGFWRMKRGIRRQPSA